MNQIRNNILCGQPRRSIQAVSISSVVDGWFERGIDSAEVLAVFDRAINLSVVYQDTSNIVTLCSEGVGDGPLNIVLNPWPKLVVSTCFSVIIRDKTIQFGGNIVECSNATVWDPTPQWTELRLVLPEVSELKLLASPYHLRSPLLSAVCCQDDCPAFFRPGLLSLQSGFRQSDLDQVSQGAAMLAGLGEGLTPAGDDFLCGFILGLWATLTEPRSFCNAILQASFPATTSLSAAFLNRAATGEVNAYWMCWLNSFFEPGNKRQQEAALDQVVSVGQSSGADMLAGFVAVNLNRD